MRLNAYARTGRRLASPGHNQLGSHRQTVAGPVALLPYLFEGEVFTTNFDYVIKNAYTNARVPFSSDFCGHRLREARQKSVMTLIASCVFTEKPIPKRGAC